MRQLIHLIAPNTLFMNAAPANSSNFSNSSNGSQHQQASKNNRVPPLESIAEDVESTQQSTTNSSTDKRKPSALRLSDKANEATGDESARPTSPGYEANASIDINCDTPASASIDIMDHASRPMPGIAAVLHHKVPKELEKETSKNDQQQTNQQNRCDNFELPNMAALESSIDDQNPVIASSLPCSPPHINLALTTNSHSIDSAEAAAIRIQSAFRGYHTRKHSPYRRRSPANASSPPGRVSGQVNGSNINGHSKKNILRQQDATILDDDDDEGVEGCERLQRNADTNQDQQGTEISSCRPSNAEQDVEESRQSRLRHRADENPSNIDSTDASSEKNTTVMSIDDVTTTEDQSTVKQLVSDTTRESRTDDQTALSGPAANRAAVLTSAEAGEQLEQSERADDSWQNKLSVAENAPAARWSTSVDTDSSNLGAALSLNEDLSEGTSRASQAQSIQEQSFQQRSSIGAAVVDEDSSVGGVNDEMNSATRGTNNQQNLDELDRATHQLEAALEEAIDKEADYYATQLVENVTDKILGDEAQQNLSELESDDIERRNPNGIVGGSRLETPQAPRFEPQPALISQDSLNEELSQPLGRDLVQPRSDVVSPDEAIGSGESSPALVASNDGNSSDDGAESEHDQEIQRQEEREETNESQAKGADDNQQAVSGGGGNGSKSKKKNRKKKGKK
jgi:hypothetical protein